MVGKNILLTIFILISVTISAEKSIVFLNPGESTEKGTGDFWRMMTDFMSEATSDLGFSLEVIYSERNHILMRKQAELLTQRENLPDFIIIVNEKLSAPTMLKTFRDLDSKVIIMHNTLTKQQYINNGHERELYKNWICSVVSDNKYAGYLLAKDLSKSIVEPPKVIAITGDKGTPVSYDRLYGLQQFIQEIGGSIYHTVFSKWSFDGGYNSALAVSRYKDVNIMWAANDAMALGAYRRVVEKGLTISVGGTGAIPMALESIKNSEMVATIGGHTFLGGWVLVMLYDYINGIDFGKSGNYMVEVNSSFIINSSNIDTYMTNIFNNYQNINFRDFTLSETEKKSYDFSMDQIIKNINVNGE